MNYENVVFGCISAGIGAILVIMGLELNITNLKNTFTQKKWKVVGISALHFVAAPFAAFAVSHLLNLDPERNMALAMVSVTPPTVAASVTTFVVGGDMELSSAASVYTLFISFLLTPAVFSIILPSSQELKLPWGQIFGILIYLIFCKSVGILLRWKLSNRTGVIKTIFKTVACCFMLTAVVIFVSQCGDLVKSTFVPDSSNLHYGSIMLYFTIYFVLSCVGAHFLSTTTSEKDAIVITAMRKNPAITLSIAASSFTNLSNEKYTKVMGMLMAHAFMLDWCSMPFIFVLRKRRLGYICSARRIPEENENNVI